MMNIKKTLLTIICMATALTFFNVSLAHTAQNKNDTKIQAMSLNTFVETHGDKKNADTQNVLNYINSLQKDDEEKNKDFACGSKITCSPGQVCLECRNASKSKGAFTQEEQNFAYYCVNESALNALNFKKNYSSESDLKGERDAISEAYNRGVNFNQKLVQLVGNEEAQEHISCTIKKEATLASGTNSLGMKKTEHCFTGETGRYCLFITGNDTYIEYANADSSMKGCEVLPVKLYNMRKCFFCPLFSVVFAAAEKMPDISFSQLAAAFATLIALGLAIWIAFQTLTHVSSLTKQDAPKFLAGLIKQSYKFLIAFLLLQYSPQIFEHAVNPVLQAGIKFGGQFLENTYVSDEAEEDIQAEINKRAESVAAHGYYIENNEEPAKEKVLYKELDRYVSDIQREIAFMQAVGSSLICTGNRAMFGKTDVETFSDGFKMILQGLVFAVFGFLLSIAFAFYLLDAVVQLGIVGALMPFLIASWPFKITAQYTGTGFKMLLNSAFIFVFIGLTVEVNMQLINAALTNNVGEKPAIQASSAENVEMGSLQKIAHAINTQNSTDLVELTDISTMGFLILVFCCIFGFKFMGQTSSLAGQFSSGGIKPSAPSIATMGASAALSGAKKVTKPVREAVGRKAEDAEMAVVGAVAHPIKTAKSIKNFVANKFRGKKGGGDSGGESESTVENKEKSKSSTVENTGGGNPKKKGPVVGQNNVNKEKTTGTTANTKPGAPNTGDNQGESGSEKNVNNETNVDNGSANINPSNQKEHKTDSRKQRKYSGKKNRNRLQKNKQRRTYGRKRK